MNQKLYFDALFKVIFKKFQIMDWEACVICGKGGDGLKCPADSLQRNGHEVYEKFLLTLEQFRKLNVLPVDVEMPSGLSNWL